MENRRSQSAATVKRQLKPLLEQLLEEIFRIVLKAPAKFCGEAA
jgi:hypothetical protein